MRACGECDETGAGQIFSVSMPIPNNQRLFSISGMIPGCDEPKYNLFEKFLWTLVDLDKEKKAPITLFINSNGGEADSFFSFYDFIAMLYSPIYTVAGGSARSAAALILLAGQKDHRYIFPNATVMLHGCRIEIDEYEKFLFFKRKKRLSREQEETINTYTKRIAGIIDKHTEGKMLELLGDWSSEKDKRKRNSAILSLLSDEVTLTAEEAVRYGVADHIVTPKIFTMLQCPEQLPGA